VSGGASNNFLAGAPLLTPTLDAFLRLQLMNN
jgi:hypothetical protein